MIKKAKPIGRGICGGEGFDRIYLDKDIIAERKERDAELAKEKARADELFDEFIALEEAIHSAGLIVTNSDDGKSYVLKKGKRKLRTLAKELKE